MIWGTLCSGEEEENEEEEDDGDEDQLNRELLIINRHIQRKCLEENSRTHSLSNVSLDFCLTPIQFSSQFDFIFSYIYLDELLIFMFYC